MCKLVGYHKASLIMFLEFYMLTFLPYKLLMLMGQYDQTEELNDRIKIGLHSKIPFSTSRISSFVYSSFLSLKIHLLRT